MRTRAGIILQARYNSTRLPGKALEAIGGRTILEHCLRRLIKAGVARVVLATTWEPEDDDPLPMQTFSYSVVYLMALFVLLLVDHYLHPVLS